jgi:hypothetical protein
VNREAITAAVWDRISNIEGVRTAARRLRHFSEVTPSEMPAIFLGVDASSSQSERGRPAAWTLKFSIYLYCHNTSKDGPWESLNGLVDAVEATLRRQPAEFMPGVTGGPTTLGGLVQSAGLTMVETDEGNLGDLGVAICSLEVLAT